MQKPLRRLLTDLLTVACSACFLVESRTTSLGDGTTHSGLDPSLSVIDPKNKMPQGLNYRQSDEGVSSVEEISFFPDDSSCVK